MPSSSLPALWGRLPAEVKERVLGSLDGKDVLQSARVVSQVHPHWHAQLRWAQPRCFAALQQQLWLIEAAADPGAPTTERSRETLEHVRQLGFKGVSGRNGLEEHLRALNRTTLQSLAALMPKITGCSLLGLKEGPALFAQWTRQSALFFGLQHLVLDCSHVTPARMRALLAGAEFTPHVKRITVGGMANTRDAVATHFLEDLNPKAPALDFACWPLLEELDLRDCKLHLGRVQLDRNDRLETLRVQGNLGADTLLTGERAPKHCLRTLTVSIELWQRHSLGQLDAAPWAKALHRLEFVRSSGELVGLNLRSCAALQLLNLGSQPVDYSTLILPHGDLQSLCLEKTTLCESNLPPPYAFAQPRPRRLLLGQNALHGVLNRLHLKACPQLEQLDLSRCNLTDADIATWDMTDCSALTHLDLSYNNFSGAVWALLTQKRLVSLRYLGLRLTIMRNDNTLVNAIIAAGSPRSCFPALEQVSIFSQGVRSWEMEDELEKLMAQADVTIHHHDLAALPMSPI